MPNLAVSPARLFVGCLLLLWIGSPALAGDAPTGEHLIDAMVEATIVTKQDRAPCFTCKIDNWSFGDTFDEARMTQPAGAMVDTTAD